MTTKKAHFSRKLFNFLSDLEKNNNREWFTANKLRYESEVKAPLLRFIEDFGPRLEKISPYLMADPRPVGGSMFRIYRDVRFAKDKRPYKGHAAAQFRHSAGKDAHAPGLYLHLEPKNVFAGAGIWRPHSAGLKLIREGIVADPKGYKRMMNGKSFKETWTMGGDSLKRPPRGFDPKHELIDELKRKDFIAVSNFSDKEACAPAFLDDFASRCRAAKPLLRFLTQSLDVRF